MDIIIQSLGFKAGKELEGYIKEKLGKLNPSDQIVRANVTLFLGPERQYRTPIARSGWKYREMTCSLRKAVPISNNRLTPL